MSYYRSYFEKNNTLIKNSHANTAKNPNTEIYYGSGFSKFIFKVDFTDLIQKLDNGDLVVDNNTRHYLNMKNTVFGDEALMGILKNNDKRRATSFDLILFEIEENWDEGVGFDFEKNEYDFNLMNKIYDERPSNWYSSTTLNSWTTTGIYSGTPIIIDTIHFDNGNEDLKVDITEYVNGIIVDGNTNYGLGLAFDIPYETVVDSVYQSVAFFTKYTQTFFEPYVESFFEDRINDNRHNFVGNVFQNLYLYVTKGGNYYDLDIEPTVDILDHTNTIIPGLIDLTTTKVRKGVYVVNFGIDGALCDGRRFFYDKWKGIEIDGVSLADVKQKFVPKLFNTQYTIGENPTEYQRYIVQYYGIKLNEKIKRGELRKVVVNLKSIDVQNVVLFDQVYYRMYIKEGRTEVNIHDWTQLDVTNENSFVLDTSYMIPREYFIEIKAKTHTEEIFHNDILKFEIVSEK